MKTCDIRIGKSLTGEWANVFSSYGTPGLEYGIETVKTEKSSSSTKFEEVTKERYEWAFSSAVDVFYVKYGTKASMRGEQSTKVVEQFSKEYFNYERTTYKVRCKPYDGHVNMFQWTWRAVDQLGNELRQSTNQYICTEGVNVNPRCPLFLCKDD